jgi:hypothetical protein
MQPFDVPNSQEMKRQTNHLIRKIEQLLKDPLPSSMVVDSNQSQAMENVRRRLLAWELRERTLEEESSSASLLMPGMALDIFPDGSSVNEAERKKSTL